MVYINIIWILGDFFFLKIVSVSIYRNFFDILIVIIIIMFKWDFGYDIVIMMDLKVVLEIF